MPAFTYILSSHSKMLYVGMTDDLWRRVFEHKTMFFIDAFTARYNINQLIYFEELPDTIAALAREKQLKGWTRAKKVSLVEKTNPLWLDLSDRWFTQAEIRSGNMKEIHGPKFSANSGSINSIVDPSTSAAPSLRM